MHSERQTPSFLGVSSVESSVISVVELGEGFLGVVVVIVVLVVVVVFGVVVVVVTI